MRDMIRFGVVNITTSDLKYYYCKFIEMKEKSNQKYYKGKIFNFSQGSSLIWKVREFFAIIRRYFQRGRNGYCHSDVWDIDSWFLNIIPNMLQDLIENTMSYPGTGEADTFEKWQEILRYMRFCFLEANETTCSRINKYNYIYEDLDKPFDERSEEWKNWYNEENKLSKYRQEMKETALNLFVKWFDDLWD